MSNHMVQTTETKASTASIEEDVKLRENDVSVSSVLQAFVKERMESFQCPAHDVQHCFRVARLAAIIATKKRDEEDGEVTRVVDVRTAFMAGLVHDVFDSKFSSTEAAAIAESRLKELLLVEPGIDTSKAEIIIKVAKNVGYKNLIRPEWDVSSLPVEYRCVQDADLLDAIGAVGIARCFAFGGRRNRLLFGGWDSFNSTSLVRPEEYASRQMSQGISGTSSLEHFFEKLLRLKSMMLTRHGKHLAERRHSVMVRYLMELGLEIGASEGAALLKRCEEEDDTRLVYDSMHNRVILCLLDEVISALWKQMYELTHIYYFDIV